MANIELKDIDDQIAKLQELRRIIADPAMSGLLNQLLAAKNGHSSLLPPVKQTERKAKKKGTFIGNIEETCRSFASAQFTVADVIKAFEAKGFVFGAENKSVAAYTAMKRLAKRGALKLEVQGVGAKPSRYSYVFRFPRE